MLHNKRKHITGKKVFPCSSCTVWNLAPNAHRSSPSLRLFQDLFSQSSCSTRIPLRGHLKSIIPSSPSWLYCRQGALVVGHVCIHNKCCTAAFVPLAPLPVRVSSNRLSLLWRAAFCNYHRIKNKADTQRPHQFKLPKMLSQSKQKCREPWAGQACVLVFSLFLKFNTVIKYQSRLQIRSVALLHHGCSESRTIIVKQTPIWHEEKVPFFLHLYERKLFCVWWRRNK